jgi:hypothetical protein
MILLIQDRKDNLHLVDYTPPSGNKFTICGLVYRRTDILNTFALYAAINNICMAHSALNDNLTRDYHYLTQGSAGPEIKYWDMSHKTWDKLTRYQRKLLRK